MSQNYINDWGSPPSKAINKYIDSLNKINNDESLFKNFRQNPSYKIILEGGEKIVGEMHIEKLKSLYGTNIFESILINLERFKENDIYGTPSVYDFEYFGKISPTTIKYISDSIDIEKNLSNKFKTIVEIGGGFGGLLKTLSVNINFKKYILIDIPEALKLAETYVSNFKDLNGKVEYISTFDNDKLKKINEIDLVIGVCSISELSPTRQLFYLNTILKNAKSIFLVYNTIHIYKKIYYKILFSLLGNYKFKIEDFNNTKYIYFVKSKSPFLINLYELINNEINRFKFRLKRFISRNYSKSGFSSGNSL